MNEQDSSCLDDARLDLYFSLAKAFNRDPEAGELERQRIVRVLELIATRPSLREALVFAAGGAYIAKTCPPAEAMTPRAMDMVRRLNELFAELHAWPLAEQFAVRDFMHANPETPSGPAETHQ